jgi:hypothetical protein
VPYCDEIIKKLRGKVSSLLIELKKDFVCRFCELSICVMYNPIVVCGHFKNPEFFIGTRIEKITMISLNHSKILLFYSQYSTHYRIVKFTINYSKIIVIDIGIKLQIHKNCLNS